MLKYITRYRVGRREGRWSSDFRSIDTEYKEIRRKRRHQTVQQRGLGRELVSEPTGFAAC